MLDTSAAIELILALPKAGRVQARLESEEWTVAAPQLLVVEVLQVLRRRVVAGLTAVDQADDVVTSDRRLANSPGHAAQVWLID